MPSSPAYGLLMLTGIVVSAVLWSRLTRRRPIPVLVFVGGLVGAVLGAKLGFLIFELPFRLDESQVWLHVLVGRTILGGLLGGYLGVEWAKRVIGYRAPTGDAFAVVVPLGLMLGRVGCFLHGCCLGLSCAPAWYAVRDHAGLPRIPATLVEAGFHLLFAAVAAVFYRRRALPGQLFHVYLMAYGAFRFISEFWRDTPRLGPISTYQILAAVLLAFAAWRFAVRRGEGALQAGGAMAG